MKYSDDSIISAAAIYDSPAEFSRKDSRLYDALRRREHLHSSVYSQFKSGNMSHDADSIVSKLLSCDSLREARSAYPKEYMAARYHKLFGYVSRELCQRDKESSRNLIYIARIDFSECRSKVFKVGISSINNLRKRVIGLQRSFGRKLKLVLVAKFEHDAMYCETEILSGLKIPKIYSDKNISGLKEVVFIPKRKLIAIKSYLISEGAQLIKGFKVFEYESRNLTPKIFI